jgi:rhamnopyranosyl-N-acetylglucosaminyl-diphospho-decaprenol beta-1,3/1,4-galactofuranosyltransferase
MTDVEKKKESVAAVVLAFSREDDLKKVIHNLKNQTKQLDEIIVVFQGSSPTILAWLKEQSGITLKHQGNVGTAGGFTSAMKLAIEKGHQWTWLFDDDAVPELNAFEEMANCKHFDSQKTGYLASIVTRPDGSVYMSPVPLDANWWYGTVLEDGCVPVMSATWIGCMVSMQSILDFGLPMEAYFMYDEDSEYTARVARSRDSYCVIKSKVVHYQNSKFDPFNNKVDMFKHGLFVRNRFATLRLEPKSAYKKYSKIWRWFFKNLREILTGKVPFETIGPLFKGLLFFRPKIKFLDK